jgi:FixJ family two-component response regulator
LAEGFLRLGLKIVRVGKPSAVSENLWDYTLDAAIDRDPEAQKAMKNAARATAHLAKLQSRKSGSMNGMISERAAKDIATAAVKASIKVRIYARVQGGSSLFCCAE